jgi:hypothetical protein
MGQTHKLEVTKLDGDTLTARLSLVSVDEINLWTSPAFFACQLHESTSGKPHAAATREALADAGLFAEQDAEDDDDGLERLDQEAAAFIASVEVGTVVDGRVTGKNGGALRVERVDRSKDPWVEVTLRATDARLFAHLEPGAFWETAPMGFGAYPEAD